MSALNENEWPNILFIDLKHSPLFVFSLSYCLLCMSIVYYLLSTVYYLVYIVYVEGSKGTLTDNTLTKVHL